MTKLFVLLLVVICACVLINAQDTTFGQKEGLGQTFEEVVVSSDLNIRRKSKENRQGKKLLTNIPLATTGQTGNPTVSRLISNDGSRVVPEKRTRRNILQKITTGLGAAGYLMQTRN